MAFRVLIGSRAIPLEREYGEFLIGSWAAWDVDEIPTIRRAYVAAHSPKFVRSCQDAVVLILPNRLCGQRRHRSLWNEDRQE